MNRDLHANSKSPNLLALVAMAPFFIVFLWFGFLYAWWPTSTFGDGQYLVYHRWKGAPPYEFAVRPIIWWLVCLMTSALVTTALTTPLCLLVMFFAKASGDEWYARMKPRPVLAFVLFASSFMSWASVPIRHWLIPGSWWGWIYIEGWDGKIPPPGAKQLPP